MPTEAINEKDWLSMQEAADYLGVSYGRFTVAVKKGVYPVSDVPGFSRKKRIRRSTLDKMLEDSSKDES